MNPEITKAVEDLQKIRDQMKVEPFKKQMDELISFYSLYGNLAVVTDIVKLSGNDAQVAVEAKRKLGELKEKVAKYFSGFNTTLTNDEKITFFRNLLTITKSDASFANVSNDIEKIISTLEVRGKEHSGDKKIDEIVDPRISKIVAMVFGSGNNKDEILKQLQTQKSEIDALKREFDAKSTEILANSIKARQSELFWLHTEYRKGFEAAWERFYRQDYDLALIEEDIKKLSDPKLSDKDIIVIGKKTSVTGVEFLGKENGLIKIKSPSSEVEITVIKKYFSGLTESSQNITVVSLAITTAGKISGNNALNSKFTKELLDLVKKEGISANVIAKLRDILQNSYNLSAQQTEQIIKGLTTDKQNFFIEYFNSLIEIPISESIKKYVEDLKKELDKPGTSANIMGRTIVFANEREKNIAVTSTILFLKRIAENPNGENFPAAISFANFLLKYVIADFTSITPDFIKKAMDEYVYGTVAIVGIWATMWGGHLLRIKREGLLGWGGEDRRRQQQYDSIDERAELEKLNRGESPIEMFTEKQARISFTAEIIEFFKYLGDEKTVKALSDFQKSSGFATYTDNRFFYNLDRILSDNNISHKFRKGIFTLLRMYGFYDNYRQELMGRFKRSRNRMEIFRKIIHDFNREKAIVENFVRLHPLFNEHEKTILDKVREVIQEKIGSASQFSNFNSFFKDIKKIDLSTGKSDLITWFQEVSNGRIDLKTLDSDLINFMERPDEKVTPERLTEEIEKAQKYITKEYPETGVKKTSPRQARMDVLIEFGETVTKGLANPTDGWVGTMSELKARIFMIVDPTRDPKKYMENPESWKNAKTGNELIRLIAQEGDKLPTIESNTLLSEGKEKGKNSAMYRELTIWEKYFEYYEKPQFKAEIQKFMEAVLKGDVNGLSGLNLTSPADFKASLGTMFGVDVSTLPTEAQLDVLMTAKGTPDALIQEYAKEGVKSRLYSILKRYELFFDIEGDEIKRRAISTIFDGIVDGDITKYEGIKFNNPAILETSLKAKIGFTGEILPSGEIAKKVVKLGNSYYVDLGLSDAEKVRVEQLRNKAQQQKLALELIEAGKLRSVVIENIGEVLKHAIKK